MVITLVILALATWRMANMLSDTNQSGPFHILDVIRHLAGVRFDGMSQPYAIHSIAEGVLCLYCCSVWFGIAWTLIYLFWPLVSFYAALPFALSAAAILVEKFHD